MKIVKHAHEARRKVMGSIVGISKKSSFEVTNCFPYMESGDDVDEDEAAGKSDDYTVKMLDVLKDVNIDNDEVGWYESCLTSAMCTRDFVNIQLSYQKRFGERVVGLVYSPLKSLQGSQLSIRAYRLSNTFMDALEENESSVTQEQIRELGLNSSMILEEIPIKIVNTPLNKALLYEMSKKQNTKSSSKRDRLNLSMNPVLEVEMKNLVSGIEKLTEEQAKFQRYERDVTRQKQQRSNWLQERRIKNAQRKEEGLEPLPEFEHDHPVFRTIPEPSRLDSLLVAKQIRSYCDRIDHFSGCGFSKQFLAGGLQKK